MLRLTMFMMLVVLLGHTDGMFVSYDGWKVLEVHLEPVSGDAPSPTLDKLRDMEGEGYLVVLSASKLKRIAEVAVSPEAFEDLSKMKDDGLISFDVVSINLERVLDLERHGEGRILPRASLKFDSYMNLDEIYSYLEALPSKYPSKVRLDEVGRSVEDRPIYRVRITNNIGDNVEKKVIFIDGGIHAREWVSPPAALFIIKKLIASKNLAKKVEWQIIPMLNPDGYVYTWTQNRLWRKNRSTHSNCYGVDLNRNFGHEWGGLGTSNNPCSDIYRGTSAFSEPESRALKDAILPLEEKLKAYITFHSFGQYFLYPWGYSTQVTHHLEAQLDAAGNAMANKITKKTNAVYTVGNSAVAFYPAAGASDDWVSSLNVPYVYTVELRDTGSYGFSLPASQIKPTVLDAWMAVKHMGKLVRKMSN